MDSKYKVLASNTLVFAAGNILVKLISFFLMPLYTNTLTTDQYGIAELLNNTIEIVLPLATLCIVEALYRFSLDEEAEHSALFVNSIFTAGIGIVLVTILSIILHYIFDYEYAIHFLILYITTTFYKITSQFARGLGHIRRYAAYGVINSLLLVISNIVLLVLLKGGITAYLSSFSIGYGVSGILAFILSKEYKYFRLCNINFKIEKKMLQYSIPSIPNMLSWWVNSLSDRYIILCFCGPGIAGLYTAASKLPAMINVVTSVFQQAWQYSTALEINQKNSKAFFSNVFRVYSYFCILICDVLIIFNKLMCRLLLQSDFFSAWKFVPLLLLAATFGCIATYFGTFYNAMKDNRMLMVSTVVGAIFNIILNIILIPSFGGTGASIATAVSYLIIMIIRMLNVQKHINIDIDLKRLTFQFSLLIVSALFEGLCGLNAIMISILSLGLIFLSDIKIFKYGISLIRRTLNRNEK